MIIPEKLNFIDWIAYLSSDFPDANIPAWDDRVDWRYIAKVVADDPRFSSYSPPAPDGYAVPEEWMRDFTKAIY